MTSIQSLPPINPKGLGIQGYPLDYVFPEDPNAERPIEEIDLSLLSKEDLADFLKYKMLPLKNRIVRTLGPGGFELVCKNNGIDTSGNLLPK